MSLALLASLGLPSCDRGHEHTAHYVQRTDAVSDGAFDRGWLPAWLPDGAHDIWESHDLDSNTVFVCFKSGGDPKLWLADAKAAELMPEKRPQIPQIGERWWPNTLEKGQWYLVQFGSDRAYLVIDANNKIVACWTVK